MQCSPEYTQFLRGMLSDWYAGDAVVLQMLLKMQPLQLSAVAEQGISYKKRKRPRNKTKKKKKKKKKEDY
ncbi:hypothetical protein N7523_004872 [Penicillium sp. IBT 18751x]|nr:hypothetical protein N7523_004872 [Penicillium sp. IBT 18751x]